MLPASAIEKEEMMGGRRGSSEYGGKAGLPHVSFSSALFHGTHTPLSPRNTPLSPRNTPLSPRNTPLSPRKTHLSLHGTHLSLHIKFLSLDTQDDDCTHPDHCSKIGDGNDGSSDGSRGSIHHRPRLYLQQKPLILTTDWQ
ncbi:hypothetical protein Pmani_038161 [Petrolisthes manimaculis]|uniref:Uncharacterized protein n=1 Tax=Petrolisthes manimaculis TaxID=1843537 RepID=A0AAE1NFE3_9EUCA|nr:hypothetical protein Pmani_038161 [Petrolisthes manimaculis]